MKKLIFGFLASFLLLFVSVSTASAVYEITDFKSEIDIQENTRIRVVETIDVNYLTSHHGIFRDIPEKKLRVISVTDPGGTPYKYEVSGGNVKNIKIGDPDLEITGPRTYVITYEVKDAIKEYPDHYELYWNITGDNWEGEIPVPSAEITSNFASITKVDCFAGYVGSSERECTQSHDDKTANFESLVNTGMGSDFTVVVGLDKNNSFVFPSTLERILDFVKEYWFYFLTPLPFVIPFYYWVKKGRDQRYLSDNIYYEPDKKNTRTVGIFERKHIPLVYSPIKGLTPAQMGTIADEKVDIQDVVAEITELARLGYLKIKKIPKKGIFGKDDYEFTRTGKDESKINEYQKIIIDGLFEDGDLVMLSALKNKFYVHLKKFKDKLYANMKSEEFFDGNPDNVRNNWTAGLIGICIAFYFATNFFVAFSGSNFLAIPLLIFFAILGLFFARAMPRRTPKGYALYRQTQGLAWYLKKGAWRHEIGEKKLFIEEVLPLAISLGVVSQLTRDMKVLNMAPPSYVGGVNTSSFASDMSGLQSSMGSTLSSAPGGSGGSGFSGGSSGGGGGGGGGGGW